MDGSLFLERLCRALQLNHDRIGIGQVGDLLVGGEGGYHFLMAVFNLCRCGGQGIYESTRWAGRYTV